MLNSSVIQYSNPKTFSKSTISNNAEEHKIYNCQICGYLGQAEEIASVRSNVRSIRNNLFSIWRCAKCQSLDCERVSDYATLYQEYPLRKQRLDYFLNVWYGVILKRLKAVGMKPSDHILDYGCGSGLFLDYLQKHGYVYSYGFDPHVQKFNSKVVLDKRYDFVISLDVIEHDLDPAAFIRKMIDQLNPGGQLCIETPNATGIDLKNVEEHIHALHLPYHVHLLTLNALKEICQSAGLKTSAVYKKWYMNSWWPGTSRSLFESYMKLGGNDIDAAFDPLTWRRIMASIPLWFHFLFGGFVPDRKNDHMMAIFSKSSDKREKQ